MVSYYSVKFAPRRHCVSGDIILLVDDYDSKYSQINPLLLFTFKAHRIKARGLLY